MDFLSVIGIVLALVAISAGQYVDGGQLEALLNAQALFIVLGGTIGAVMLQTPLSNFRKAFVILIWVIKPPKILFKDTIRKIVVWSRQARQGGVMALEHCAENESDPFSKKGLDSLAQGCDVLTLRRMMEVEIDSLEHAQLQAANVFDSMGGYAPTIGIIGAVIGLIEVMRNLSDPSELGTGIAIAFVATIYGVGFANLLFLPIANKLKAQIQKQTHYREMILEGLVSIAQGEHPILLEKKLNGFMSR